MLFGSSRGSSAKPVDGESVAVSPSPPHVRRKQQQPPHHYPVANSISGGFSDVSRRYSVDRSRVLGTGVGMTVCVCTDLETGEHYAVKTIDKGHRKRGAKKRDLHREVSLLRDLRDKAGEGGGSSGRREAGRYSFIFSRAMKRNNNVSEMAGATVDKSPTDSMLAPSIL